MNDVEALQVALDAAAPAPTIVVWAKKRQRLMTYRPLVADLAAAGHRVFAVMAPLANVADTDLADAGVPHVYRIPPEALSRLTGVSLVISSERDIVDAPSDTRRFAIHHSLPDTRLPNDYLIKLQRQPLSVAAVDYYAIAVKQRDKNWRVDRYAPHVDRIFPPGMLRHRRASLAMVPMGYPKIDRYMSETPDPVLDTITYAPTQSVMSHGHVLQHGTEIIALLLETFPDHLVAFRPFPTENEQRRVAEVYARFENNARFRCDLTPTGAALMKRTALLVSDRSSVALSFGLGLARPVIFHDPLAFKSDEETDLKPFPPIGLRAATLPALQRGALELFANREDAARNIAAKRKHFIYNPGQSLTYLAQIIPDILADRSRLEWLEIPRRPFTDSDPAARRAHFKAMRAKLKRLKPRNRNDAIRTFRRALGVPRGTAKPTDRRLGARIRSRLKAWFRG